MSMTVLTNRRLPSTSKLRVAGVLALLGVAAATSSAAAAGPATTEPPPSEEVTVLQDTRGRITVTVPADWTDTSRGFTVADDGRLRPRIQASPDLAATADGWTTPWLRFDAKPSSTEPATLLDAIRYSQRCVDGGIEPFETDTFVGLRQTWDECGGGTFQIVHIAARAVDDGYTAFLRVGVPRPDDPALELILGSFGAVPGAQVFPPNADPDSLAVRGPVGDDLLRVIVPNDAVEVTDDTETLTLAVPGDWTDIATGPDTNDDRSDRPTIRASTDLAGYTGWDSPGVRVRVVPAIDPSVLLANHDWPSQRCADSGVRSYESGDGEFTGLVQMWTECSSTDARMVIAALATPDESATVLVESKLIDGDDSALGIVLASLRLDPPVPETTAVENVDDETDAFCTAFAPLNERGDEIFADGEPDTSALRELIREAVALDPPAAIAADFALMLEAFALFADGLDGDQAARDALSQRFDEFDLADERLEPFMRDVCGLEYGD